jgi:hypothetical protein
MRIGMVVTAFGLLLGPTLRADAGGNVVALTRLRGKVEIRSVQPGGRWRPARAGTLSGSYLVRTGRGSSVHLQEKGGWVPRRFGQACMDANGLLRVDSTCGFRLQVLKGRLSAADGKRGPSTVTRAAG